MTKLSIDTSAFLKLYLPEKGSSWLKTFIVGKEIIISQLVLFESANSLARLYQEGSFSKPDAIALYRQIEKDSSKHVLIPLGTQEQLDKVIDIVFNLATSLRLRTLDSIHLAVAEITHEAVNKLTPPETLTFVSSDLRLLQVAQSKGITTENPEDYP